MNKGLEGQYEASLTQIEGQYGVFSVSIITIYGKSNTWPVTAIFAVLSIIYKTIWMGYWKRSGKIIRRDEIKIRNENVIFTGSRFN